jgi:hypothetical protein
MATLIYPTELREAGPLILASDDLLELEKVLQLEWERLGKHEQELIERTVAEETKHEQEIIERTVREEEQRGEAISQEVRSRIERREEQRREDTFRQIRSRIENYRLRSLTMLLAGGEKLAVENFAEAEKHHELMRESVTGFDLQMRRGNVRLGVRVQRRGYDGIEIEATPAESEDARQLFGALRNWVQKIRLPGWQRAWAAGAGLLGFVVWWLYLLLVLWILFTSFRSDNRDALRAQAHQLLKNGVTAGEQSKAIELLLALDSDYDIGAEPRGMTGRGWILLVCGAAVALAVCIPPKTTIGIGRGSAAVKRWRAWARFVGFTVPTVIFGNLVWPQIQQLISSVWGH